MSENYKLITMEDNGRVELHDALGLTGCEATVNTLPAGVAVPFVHAHKQNEELYIVLEGRGELYIDGKVEPIAAGQAFRIDCAGHRAIRASADSAIKFICVQTKTGSLEGFTMGDGVGVDEKAPWH